MSEPTISAVICSLYGDKDAVPPRPDVPMDVDCILVTDVQGIGPETGWTVRYQPREHLHPRMAAKHAKCLPWEYTDAKTVMWVDASCRFINPRTYEWLDEQADLARANGCNLVQFDHPWRQDIRDEAEASVGMLKYANQPVLDQASHYLSQGHPRGWGLFATGLMIWDAQGPMEKQKLVNFGQQWLAEQVAWGIQDQISQPYLLRKNGIGVHKLNATLHGNGMLEWLIHRSES